MTDFCETRVENLKSKEDKKKASAGAKKANKKSAKKRKQEDSYSSVVEHSVESSIERQPNRKYYILHTKFSSSKGNGKDPRALVNKHKQKKRVVSRTTERATRNSIL